MDRDLGSAEFPRRKAMWRLGPCLSWAGPHWEWPPQCGNREGEKAESSRVRGPGPSAGCSVRTPPGIASPVYPYQFPQRWCCDDQAIGGPLFPLLRMPPSA